MWHQLVYLYFHNGVFAIIHYTDGHFGICKKVKNNKQFK